VSPVKCNENINPAGQVLGMAGTDFRPVGRAGPAFRLGGWATFGRGISPPHYTGICTVSLLIVFPRTLP